MTIRQKRTAWETKTAWKEKAAFRQSTIGSTNLKNDRLQQKELEMVRVKLAELTAAVNAHDGRLKTLEMQPVTAQAARWKQIIDAAFKFAIGAGLSYIALKLGLSK